MLEHLFVYGTLMSGAGHPMGARLGREGRLVGPALIAGRLFDLGRYPALIETGADDGHVHGEVYVLSNPAEAFRWLDRYESIVPGREAQSAYTRVERTAQLAAGGAITAWVYLYRAPLGGAAVIESGRWLPRQVGSQEL